MKALLVLILTAINTASSKYTRFTTEYHHASIMS